MKFKVIKSSFDGLCGGERSYDNVKDVCNEISWWYGWKTLEELHQAITKWSKDCRPGDTFCTSASCIIAVAIDSVAYASDVCPHCDYGGLDYDDLDPTEDGIQQLVQCPNCEKRWMDIFGLIERKEIYDH